MQFIIGAVLLIFALTILWHAMREIGVGPTLRVLGTIGAAVLLIGLFGGSRDDRHH